MAEPDFQLILSYLQQIASLLHSLLGATYSLHEDMHDLTLAVNNLHHNVMRLPARRPNSETPHNGRPTTPGL